MIGYTLISMYDRINSGILNLGKVHDTLENLMLVSYFFLITFNLSQIIIFAHQCNCIERTQYSNISFNIPFANMSALYP